MKLCIIFFLKNLFLVYFCNSVIISFYPRENNCRFEEKKKIDKTQESKDEVESYVLHCVIPELL